jgi:Ca2+-binding RTX toxin-like protein
VKEVTFDGIDKITLGGEINDTLVLPAESTWDYLSNTVMSVDMGGDGDFHDADGGWMRDYVDACSLEHGVTAHLENVAAQTVYQGSTLLVNLTSANGFGGTAYDDAVYAPNDGASLDGRAGNDTLIGGAAADALRGGSGADLLVGGAGADVLDGDDGADVIEGGLGNDLLLVGGEAENWTTVEIEHAFGGEGDDRFLVRGSNALELDGGAGNDAYARFDGYFEGVVLSFNEGDGNDRVQTASMFSTVNFTDLGRDDLMVVWDAHAVFTQAGEEQLVGDFAVIIKSTGESIIFEDAWGLAHGLRVVRSGTIPLDGLPILKPTMAD